MRRIVNLDIKGHYHVDVPMADSWAYIKTFGAVPFYVNGIYEGVEEYGNMLYTSRPAEQTEMDIEFSGSTNAFNFTTRNAGWVKYVSQLLIRNDIKLKWISVDNYLNSNEEVLCCPFVTEKDCFSTRDVNIAPVLNSDGRYYWHFDAALNEQNICLLGFTEFAEDGQEFSFQFCFESENDMGVWDEEEDAKFAIVKQVLYPVTFDSNMTVATHGEVIESGDEVRRGSRLVLSHKTLPENIFLYYEVNGERLDGSNIIVNEALNINAVYVEVAVQSVSESIGNYNPAVSIVLERNNIGTYVDNDDHTKGWYLSKADAAERTTIPAFTNITSVADANGIVVESEGDVTTTYDFTDFEELQWFGIKNLFSSDTSGDFQNCTLLENLVLPDTLEIIGYKCFWNCPLLSIDVTDKLYNVISIGAGAFAIQGVTGIVNMPNLIELGGNFDGAGAYAQKTFRSANISEVRSLGHVTVIGSGAFAGCVSLKKVLLPDGVILRDQVYNYSNGFGGCFERCTNLEEVVFGSSVTYIGTMCFAYCSSLNIDISNLFENSTHLGFGCFVGTAVRGKINMPLLIDIDNAVNHNGAFESCVNIDEIVDLGSVTELYGGIFKGCIGLRKIKLPKSLTSIKEYVNGVFQNCNSVEEIVSYNTTPPTITGTRNFINVPSTCPIYVPAASVSAYQAASGWSDRAAYIQAISGNFEVTLGANVTAVDQDSNVVNSGDTVAAGTVLTLTATTVAGQTFDHFTVNGTAITGSSYTVYEAVTIEAVYTTE